MLSTVRSREFTYVRRAALGQGLVPGSDCGPVSAAKRRLRALLEVVLPVPPPRQPLAHHPEQVQAPPLPTADSGSVPSFGALWDYGVGGHGAVLRMYGRANEPVAECPLSE